MSNKNNETANLSIFGKSFQENLARLILLDRSFCNQIQEVLEPMYFEQKYLQVFTRKVFDYKTEYKIHPSINIMKAVIRTDLNDENDLVQEQIRSFFAKSFSTEDYNNVGDQEYIKDKSLDFCRKQVLKKAILESVDLLNKCSFDEISTTINNALKKGENNDFGYDYIEDFEKRFEIKSRAPISTGWEAIDSICKGGMGKRELSIIIATSGTGKSQLMVFLGAQAIKAGKTVVYYTLELADTLVASRFDSCITGFSINELHRFKDQVFEMVKDVPGKLIIKEYPTKSASVITLRNHLEKLRQNDINPDMILVDYGDLLKSISIYKEKRLDLEAIFEDLRAIAQEYDCSLITASQANRNNFNSEVIGLDGIAESFAKTFVADFVISLSRSTEDKNSNTGRLFIAKNRNGPDGIVFPIFMDTATSTIKILGNNIETKEDKDVKEKYKEHLRNIKEKKNV